MAKLNKSEIEAIANKTYNALEKIAKQRKIDAMKSYNPSENYTHMVSLAIKRDRLQKEFQETNNELDQFGRENYNYYWFCNKSVDDIKDFIIKEECKLPEFPSKEELIDDVTIAAIDKDFDTNKFINDIINKFNK